MKRLRFLSLGLRWVGEALLASLITSAVASCGGNVTEEPPDESDAGSDGEAGPMLDGALTYDGGAEGGPDVMTDGMPMFDGGAEGGADVMTDGMPMFDGGAEGGADVMTDGMPMFDGGPEGGAGDY
jgi:hypothetical protein